MSTTYQIVYPYVVIKFTENTCPWYKDSINTAMKDGTETYWRRSTFKIGEGQLRFFANKKPIRNHRVNKSPFLPDMVYVLSGFSVQ